MNLRYPPDSESVLDDADHDQLALRQRIGQQAERGCSPSQVRETEPCCGDLVESGGDLVAELIVAVPGHGAERDGSDQAERPGQVTGDRAEDVLIARAEDDVRAHAGRRLGYAPGDELGVPLTAAFWLAVGYMPFPVVQRGRPTRVRVVLRAGTGTDREPPGGILIPGGVRDHRRAVTVCQHDHVRRAPRGGGGYLQQARKRVASWEPGRVRFTDPVGCGRLSAALGRFGVLGLFCGDGGPRCEVAVGEGAACG